MIENINIPKQKRELSDCSETILILYEKSPLKKDYFVTQMKRRRDGFAICAAVRATCLQAVGRKEQQEEARMGR